MLQRLGLPIFLAFVTLGSIASQPIKAAEGLDILSMGAPIGLRALAPGRWGAVRIMVRNATSEDQFVPGTVYFKDNPELRFSRQVWVPAGTTRMSWIPIYLPSDAEPGQLWEILGTSEAGTEEGVSNASILAQIYEPNAMAYLADRGSLDDSNDNKTLDEAYEAAIALRESRSLTRTMSLITDRLLPSTVEGWNAIDHVIIAGDRISEDSAAEASLRQWISEGGRLWIQLNHTSPDTVRSLLGSAFQAHIVDQVPLNSFRMDVFNAIDDTGSFLVERESPVDFIRMYVENAEVVYEIDGWPAAFFIPYGHGEILVTTLDGHGWMRRRGPEDAAYSDPRYYTDFIALDPMRDLAARFISPPFPATLPEDVRAEYATDRIGYEAPERSFIFTVLGAFCSGIAVLGLVLGYKHRLEHLAWMTVAMGLIATLVIVGSGWSSHQTVPTTASSIQVVDVSPQSGDFASAASIAYYQPDQAAATIATEQGTRIIPEFTSLDGRIRTMEWLDFDRWQWQGTEFPPGIQVALAYRGSSLKSPVRAAAQLGPDGLSGHLDAGEFNASASDAEQRGPNDGVIVFPFASPLAANLSPSGDFQSSAKDLLSEGQFFNDALLDDEQRRRQEVVAAWHSNYRDSLSMVPTFVAWINGSEDVLTWPDSVQKMGAKLLVVPLELERTPPDTPVVVPGSLIVANAIRSALGQSTIFNNKLHSWSYPNAQASTTRLRFQLPDSVLPMRAESAELHIDCNIPSRSLTIWAISGDESTEIFQRSNPTGMLTVELSADKGLSVDASGGVVIEFEISELSIEVKEKTMSNSAWSIRSTRLDVKGKTLAIGEGTAE